ncbi:hypothetical protein LPH56_12040 (plasmid) [Xylella taiwanensis]|uniref:hypothetical protein n=1 Tax=Xylella taiwanensis TaxID=1444770 RepID=UPI001E572A71|nr:hypothetical protein [Xylella taiwanensis]UFN42563.1 hypothetical protein LPH57_12055 [Xylella taiwanensis]UFS50822.1 hypothetical protein LPH54_12040 [Xylella taiwanensis]UFS53114.1 hypothetical protein LPH56_12040 [Xylella taiwanensis]
MLPELQAIFLTQDKESKTMYIIEITKKFFVFLLGFYAFFTLSFACMALADPGTRLVRSLGCFDSYDWTESYLLNVQSEPLFFAVISGAILTIYMLCAAISFWRNYQGRTT